jgi:hypothetical protein
LPGGHSEREPPDPIPNSEVKTLCADGSVPFGHARVGHCQASNRKPRWETSGVFCFLRLLPHLGPRDPRIDPLPELYLQQDFTPIEIQEPHEIAARIRRVC